MDGRRRDGLPCELTNGGLNTTALISAGKLHASLSTSLGVIADGRHIDRWYAAANGSAGGYNSTTTRVWANLDFKAGVSTTTVEYYPGSGDELFVATLAGSLRRGLFRLTMSYSSMMGSTTIASRLRSHRKRRTVPRAPFTVTARRFTGFSTRCGLSTPRRPRIHCRQATPKSRCSIYRPAVTRSGSGPTSAV